MIEHRRKFSPQFKAEAVQQVQARGRMLDALQRWATALRPLRAADRRDSTEADTAAPATGRPRLHQPSDADTADEAVRLLLDRLQTGGETGNADRFDSLFADDVLWGSPYGQVLTGYAPLNQVHRSMMAAPPVGASRYEVVQTCAPTPDVVLTHVRRRSLAAAPGGPDFSEMALYVLIRRNGQWWLAAGQNTLIREKP